MCSDIMDSSQDLRDSLASLPEPIASVAFRRRDGLPEVPLWHKVEERWFRYPGCPASLFAYVPQHLCERLVALEGNLDQPLKEEWIEYTSAIAEQPRMFVRVDLVLETNNSVTIELLENHIADNNVAVWWRHDSV